MDTQQKLTRWRLILGAQTESEFQKLDPDFKLDRRGLALDAALAAVYGGIGEAAGGGAGLGPSHPQITKWLKDIRSLFDPDLVKVIQQDAIERKGWKQLLMEPELLEQLEPDLEMASVLLTLKDLIPVKSKDQARAYIRKIVELINRQLASQLQRCVHAALAKQEHSPLPSAAAIDFPYTVRKI